jgi:lipopolysaccharide transport system permease protein
MTSATQPIASERVVRPAPRWRGFGLGELWHSRELLLFFAWRDLKVRYKQTAFGVAWAVLQPLAYTFVFTIFLGRIGHIAHGRLPYALIALSGSTIWLFFSNSVNQAASSLVGGAGLITKVYFPRLLVAIAPSIAALADLVLSLVVLLGVSAVYGYDPSPVRVWAAAPFTLVAWLASLGVGSFLAALNVKYRDVRYAVPLGMQLWLFVSPVAYAPLHLQGTWLTLYFLNPMAGPVAGFRWAVLGGSLPWQAGLSVVTALLVLVVGVGYFRNKEREFADVV